jgi:hypothetical protein
METSIETLLSRKRENEEVHPITKWLAALPGIGSFVHSWARATQNTAPKELWVSLPPVVA